MTCPSPHPPSHSLRQWSMEMKESSCCSSCTGCMHLPPQVRIRRLLRSCEQRRVGSPPYSSTNKVLVGASSEGAITNRIIQALLPELWHISTYFRGWLKIHLKHRSSLPSSGSAPHHRQTKIRLGQQLSSAWWATWVGFAQQRKQVGELDQALAPVSGSSTQASFDISFCLLHGLLGFRAIIL